MKALLTLSIILASSLVSAESLEERKYWSKQMSDVDEEIKYGEEECGVTFGFEFVDKPALRAGYEKVKSQSERHRPGYVCAMVMGEAVRLCREGDKPKAAVASKIKSFKCGFSKARKITLKGGVLTFMGNYEQEHPEQWVREQLLKNLPKSANVPGPK